MDVKIESMIFGWDERIPEVLVKFINSVTLTKGRTGASRTGESICTKQGVQPLLCLRIREQPLLAQTKDGI